MKRRLLTVMLGLAMMFTLAACDGAGNADPPEKQGAKTDTSETGGSNARNDGRSDVLVVVFSATGTTKRVAEKIAVQTGAGLKEIIPAAPYSSADLNYSDSGSRTSREQNDATARPAIAENISIEGYKIVYLGYPIWWGQAPRILSTFVESHDFSGVTVIPFCTSGSSDIGQSDDALAAQAGSGNWVQGKRFSGSVTESELKKWIDDTKPTETEGADMEKTLRLIINDTEVAVEWEKNESVDALTELVSAKDLTIQMSMYGGFEQVGSLGRSLPRNDVQTTTSAGDIMLYSGDKIVVFYGSNSWAYTRLGRITDQSAADMTRLLNNGNVTLKITYGG